MLSALLTAPLFQSRSLMTADSTASSPDEPTVPFDSRQPSIPRVYGDWRHGKDTFAPDRAVADMVIGKVPEFRDVVRQNWEFQKRAVEFLAKAGIRQFLDIGPGIPVVGERLLHHIAREHQPEASWVAVDNDTQVLVRWRQEFDRGDDRLQVIYGDLRGPVPILKKSQRFLDRKRATAVFMGAVMHFVTAQDRPAEITQTFREALAPGSWLVFTNATADGAEGEAKTHLEEAAQQYAKEVAPIILRSRDEVSPLLDGWMLWEPGLVRTVDLLVPDEGLIYVEHAPHALAALARKPPD
jgi:hypothetical protein